MSYLRKMLAKGILVIAVIHAFPGHASCDEAKVLSESDVAIKWLREYGNVIHVNDRDGRPFVSVTAKKQFDDFLDRYKFNQLAKVANLKKLKIRDVSDKDLEYIGRLTELKVLTMSLSRSEAGLRFLKNLSKLKSLNVDGDVSDAGLKHIGKLASLTDLSIWSPNITDKGIAHLRGLKLEYLVLGRTNVGDEGLQVLGGNDHLQYLLIDPATHVTDRGLASLAQLHRLKSLTLLGSKVTDAGASHLASLKMLEFLALNNAKISDVGLKHMSGLTQLKRLCLSETMVTSEGVKKLQKQLPRLIIETAPLSRGSIHGVEIR